MALGLKYGQAADQDLDSRQKTNEVTDITLQCYYRIEK